MISASPPSSSSDDTATFAFTGQDAVSVTFSCMLSVAGASPAQPAVQAGTVNSSPIALGAFRNCTSPQTFHWLLPGAWTFQVQATDAAGNSAAQPLEYKWDVAFDAGQAYARLLGGPFALVKKTSIVFNVTALSVDASGDTVEDDNAGTECWMQSNAQAAASYSSCSGSVPYGFLSDGTYR